MRPRNWLIGLAFLFRVGNAAVAAEKVQDIIRRSTRNGVFF